MGCASAKEYVAIWRFILTPNTTTTHLHLFCLYQLLVGIWS